MSTRRTWKKCLLEFSVLTVLVGMITSLGPDFAESIGGVGEALGETAGAAIEADRSVGLQFQMINLNRRATAGTSSGLTQNLVNGLEYTYGGE